MTPRAESSIEAMVGSSWRQVFTSSPRARLVHAIGGARKVDLGGPAHDDLVGPVGDDQQLAEGAGGHEDAGAVGGIADAPKHAADRVELVGHGAVRALGQHHQLGAGLDAEVRARRRPSTTPLGSSGSSQLAPIDLLVDQAHPGVPLDIHTSKRHAGRGLPRRGHAVGQEPGAGGEAFRIERREQCFGILDPRVDGGIVAVAAGEDLHVPHLEVEDVALHVRR